MKLLKNMKCASDVMENNFFEILFEKFEMKGFVEFTVKVAPNQAKTVLLPPLPNGFYKMKVAATAQQGKANLKIINYFSELFSVSKYNVEIKTGSTSAIKRIRVEK